MMWTVPPNLPTADEIQRLALTRGVGLYPLYKAAAHEYGKAHLRDRSLVLGYTALSEGEIRDAIARVAAAIKE
jgi:GntR family transcriptional regulator / MocR family aminotransferase